MVSYVVAVDDHDPYFLRLLRKRAHHQNDDDVFEAFNEEQTDRIRPYLRSIFTFKTRRHPRLLVLNPTPIYERYRTQEAVPKKVRGKSVNVRKGDSLMGLCIPPLESRHTPFVSSIKLRREGSMSPGELLETFRSGRYPTAWLMHCGDANADGREYRGWINSLEEQFKRKV